MAQIMPGGVGGALPMPPKPPSLASPETQSPPPGAESRTLLASPLADRLAGPLMHHQQQQQTAKVAEMLRKGLDLLANQMAQTDPKGAAELKTMSAKLMRKFADPGKGPQTPGQLGQMAGALPAMGGQQGAMPPPPVPGMGGPPSPLSGPR